MIVTLTLTDTHYIDEESGGGIPYLRLWNYKGKAVAGDVLQLRAPQSRIEQVCAKSVHQRSDWGAIKAGATYFDVLKVYKVDEAFMPYVVLHILPMSGTIDEYNARQKSSVVPFSKPTRFSKK